MSISLGKQVLQDCHMYEPCLFWLNSEGPQNQGHTILLGHSGHSRYSRVAKKTCAMEIDNEIQYSERRNHWGHGHCLLDGSTAWLTTSTIMGTQLAKTLWCWTIESHSAFIWSCIRSVGNLTSWNILRSSRSIPVTLQSKASFENLIVLA